MKPRRTPRCAAAADRRLDLQQSRQENTSNCGLPGRGHMEPQNQCERYRKGVEISHHTDDALGSGQAQLGRAAAKFDSGFEPGFTTAREAEDSVDNEADDVEDNDEHDTGPYQDSGDL